MSRRCLRTAARLHLSFDRPPSVLPIRTLARAFNTTSQIVEPTQPSADDAVVHSTRPAARPVSGAAAGPEPPTAAVDSRSTADSSLAQHSSPPTISESVRRLLPHLAAQPGQYIRIHIHGFPYLVTAGDQLRLPFKMPDVLPGDVLRLNRASVLGSRDFTLQGGTDGSGSSSSDSSSESAPAPLPGRGRGSEGPVTRQAAYIDERLFECRAVVLGTESEPMRRKVKTMRRRRRTRTIKSKHRYTILRINELKINRLEDLDG